MTQEIFDTINRLMSIVIPILLFGACFFFYRKAYFHFKFVGLYDKRIQGKSILILLIKPILFLELFYIFIPIFIKSQRKKEGQELILETKIFNDTKAFWILFGLVVFLPFILFGLENKLN